jgi:hypothetical protein
VQHHDGREQRITLDPFILDSIAADGLEKYDGDSAR